MRKDIAVSEDITESLKNTFVFSCNVGMNSFVVDYKGNMCPCMKLKHYGIKLLENTYDSIWERFSAFSKWNLLNLTNVANVIHGIIVMFVLRRWTLCLEIMNIGR